MGTPHVEGNGELAVGASSRRAMVRLLVGSGGWGLALAGAAVSRPGRSVLAQEFAAERDVLNYALFLEHLAHAFYRDGLTALGEAVFRRERPAEVYANLRSIREHEEEHVRALAAMVVDLGGTPAKELRYDFGYADVGGFLAVAAWLENTAAMAYSGALGVVRAPELGAAVAAIAMVEARHAAYLGQLIGASPFPAAFEAPAPAAQILVQAGMFIVP